MFLRVEINLKIFGKVKSLLCFCEGETLFEIGVEKLVDLCFSGCGLETTLDRIKNNSLTG